MKQTAGFSFYKVLHSGTQAQSAGTPVKIDALGRGAPVVLALQIEGISGDTITFEGTINGTDWYAVQLENLTDGTKGSTAAADGLYRGVVLGLRQVRANVTTYGAGDISVVGYIAS